MSTESNITFIGSVEVTREPDGEWTHPDLPFFDEGDETALLQWLRDQQLEVAQICLEYDADEAIAERYFESGNPDFSYWEPSKPEGDGWFALSFHDSENGPVCWWARRNAEKAGIVE